MAKCSICGAEAEDTRISPDVTFCNDCHLFFHHGVINMMEKDQSANRRATAEAGVEVSRPTWHKYVYGGIKKG